MVTAPAKGVLWDVPSSEYGKLDLESLVELHNIWSEQDLEADEALSRLLLQHELFKAAIGGIGDGVVVEIGYHRAITLDQLAKKLSAELPSALVVGLDKGGYRPESPTEEFYFTQPEYLLEAEKRIGRQVFNSGWERANRLTVQTHARNPNAFAVHGATAEQVLLPDAADLVFIKAMFGYFGSTPKESLRYFQSVVLPRARRLFIIDYIGQCNFTKVGIPRPEAVAQTITAMYPNASVSFQRGENYFIMYARR